MQVKVYVDALLTRTVFDAKPRTSIQSETQSAIIKTPDNISMHTLENRKENDTESMSSVAEISDLGGDLSDRELDKLLSTQVKVTPSAPREVTIKKVKIQKENDSDKRLSEALANLTEAQKTIQILTQEKLDLTCKLSIEKEALTKEHQSQIDRLKGEQEARLSALIQEQAVKAEADTSLKLQTQLLDNEIKISDLKRAHLEEVRP